MTISIKHKFVNPKWNTADTTVTRAADWNDEHEITLAQNRVLGRVSAGNGPVEEITGAQIRTLSDTAQSGVLAGVDTRTASYTLTLADRGKVIEMNVANANTITVPNETGIGGVNYPIGTQIMVVQLGQGQTTINPASGVFLKAVAGGSRTTTRYSAVLLYKRASNDWLALDQPYANASATAAAASATSAAASAALAGGRADDIAALAGFRDFANLAALLANTTLTYTAGQSTTVVANEIIRTREEGFSYQVQLSGSSTNHLATAGGVKLNVIAGPAGYNVKAFNAKGDDSTDDSTAIQTAINTGKTVTFPTGIYLANNLTQTEWGQRFLADGQVSIKKNANGVLLSASGDYLELNGLQFLGSGYTGSNIELTGNHPRLINCSSWDTPGRAVKATGAHVQIIGTCGSYSTTDTTNTGYDIEIGVSGTATLYHFLAHVYTSSQTGGILLTDVGSHVLIGSQIGKLTVKSGTAPAGTNGGMHANNRILGDVNVELSNSVFTGNQFSTQTITFATGTSLHVLDQSNNTSTATIVNNGNANSAIIKSVGTGSPAGIILDYAGAGNNQIRYVDSLVEFLNQDVQIPNNRAYRAKNAAGVAYNGLSLSTSGNWAVGSNTGATFTTVNSGSGGVYLAVSDTSIAQAYTDGFRPYTDNTLVLGMSSQRWSTIYAGTGTINTSDRKEKQQIVDLSAAEKAVAAELKTLIRKFKFNDAVERKGSDARWHFGAIAQDVESAFAAHGLKADDYGMFCSDKWDAQDEIVDEDGRVVQPQREAGERLGLRYDELFAFILAAM